MTRLHAAYLAVVLLAGHALADEPAVKAEYDPDTSQFMTFVEIDALSEGNTTYRHYRFQVLGMGENPSKVEVSWDVKSNRVDIFDCKTASLTADGKKVVFATKFEQYSGDELDAPGVRFRTSLTADLAAKDFARLASAKQVKGEFCGRTFTLRPKERAALRQLAVALKMLKRK